MFKKTVTIVLPTYEEAESLPSLIAAIDTIRVDDLADLSLLIVDDNSNDGTESLIEELSLPWIRLIVRRNERGLSSAVLRGLQEVDTEFCVIMDADGSHPALAVPTTIRALQDGADFVVGSRYVQGGTTEDGWGVLRWINSKIATLMARPFTSVLDPMSGFLAFRHSILQDAAEINPVGYKIGLELIVKCGCTKVTEIPIHFRTRQLGKSKLTLRVQWEYLQHVILLLRFTHPKLVSFFTFAAVGASGVAVYIASLLATTRLLVLVQEYLADTDFFIKAKDDGIVFEVLASLSSDLLAIVLSVWIAMTWNFIWDRKYAFWFARQKNIVLQYFGFVVICSVGAFANFYITLSLSKSETMAIAGLVGATLGAAIGLAFNYFVNRILIFRR